LCLRFLLAITTQATAAGSTAADSNNSASSNTAATTNNDDNAVSNGVHSADNQDSVSVQAVQAGFVPLECQKAHPSSQSIDENLGVRCESTRSLGAGFHTPWSSVTDLQSMGHRDTSHSSLSNLQQHQHSTTVHGDAAYDTHDAYSHDDNNANHYSRRYSYRGDNWAPTVENVSLSLCGHLISETSVLDAETAHEAFVSNSITWQEFCTNPEVRAAIIYSVMHCYKFDTILIVCIRCMYMI
jgi:hypothetical protein